MKKCFLNSSHGRDENRVLKKGRGTRARGEEWENLDLVQILPFAGEWDAFKVSKVNSSLSPRMKRVDESE